MSQPRVNNKGLTTLARVKKDPYFLYEALLRNDSVLHIGASDWKNRAGVVDASGRCVQKVQVFSNASEVMLTCNGVLVGSKPVEANIATFDVPFVDGKNLLMAVAGTSVDMLEVHVQAVPDKFSDFGGQFSELNVMLGSQRYFDDKESGICWIPEKEYEPGSWGYVGGCSLYESRTQKQYRVFTEVDIKGTDKEPIYQTQREGIDGFRADVPDGCYSIYLYFAELASSEDREKLVYVLGNDAEYKKSSDRIFDVFINSVKVLDAFNIAKECGEETAVVKKFIVNVTGGQGVELRFESQKGQPVLNALRLYRNF